jgi:tetratricopeptide (TPR) repeat protein
MTRPLAVPALAGTLLLAFAAVTHSTVAPTSASAQDVDHEDGASDDPGLNDARAHFKLGVDFFKERNYRGALIEFRTAYELRPNYKLLYNLGQACVELNEYANAITYFTRYLRESGDDLPASRRTETEQLIESLQQRMAKVSILSNQYDPEIFVDDTSVGRLPGASVLALSAGRHRITAKKPGLVNVEAIVDLAAGEKRPLRLDFAHPQLSPLTATNERKQGWRITPPVAATAIGTGAVLIGAATMSLITLQAEHEYDATRRTLTTEAELSDLRSDAVTKARITDILWGTTIAGAAVTATLFALSQSDDEARPPGSTSVSVQFGETSSFTLHGSF